MSQQGNLFAVEKTADVHVDRLGIPHDGAPIVVSWGAGVDSTAMLVAMKREGVTPDRILFADTGGEKPETYAYVDYIEPWLASWGAPPVTRVMKKPSPRVSYTTLEGNCLDNETLPSLAFGLHSCSIKWKGSVLDQALTGVSRGPNKRHGWQPALDAWGAGLKVVKLIGYDNGPADTRRRKRIAAEDERFRYVFPLRTLGWARKECVQALIDEGLRVPLKSACFFCPASKQWELWWLAGAHPDLFMRALKIERNALEGRHSRWDKVKFGGSWWSYIEGKPAVSVRGSGGSRPAILLEPVRRRERDRRYRRTVRRRSRALSGHGRGAAPGRQRAGSARDAAGPATSPSASPLRWR